MKKYFCLTVIIMTILSACTNQSAQTPDAHKPGGMSQQEKDARNKETIMNCFKAYAAHDSTWLLQQNTDDVINIYSGRPPVRGKDSARIVLREAFKLIKGYHPSNQVAVAENNYVFVFQYIDLTNYKDEVIWHGKQVEIFKFNDAGKMIVHTGAGEDMLPVDERVVF